MITFVRQLLATLHTGHFYLFELYVVFVWCAMLPRMIGAWRFHVLARRARRRERPQAEHAVSAVVTVYREEREDLVRCLSTLKEALEQGTVWHELIVIVDGLAPGESNGEVEIARHYADVVLTTDARNKRRNLRVLVRESRADILLLVDSDTFFEPDTVRELLRPFADPRVGGATTAQTIHRPRTVMQLLSNWLEHARLNSSMAAASLFRQVACLPGRAYAVRKRLVEPHLDELVGETFLGRPCIAGDDRYITNLVLRQGYGAVLVPSARVTTLAPAGFLQTSRMWLRWGRSSQRYTIQSPWLFRYPFAAFVYWGDILVTASTFFIVAIHWPYQMLTGVSDQPFLEMVFTATLGMMLTMGIRQMPHLLRHPRDLLYLPVFVLVATYLQFIRFYALLTIHQVDRWGTRPGADATRRAEPHVRTVLDRRTPIPPTIPSPVAAPACPDRSGPFATWPGRAVPESSAMAHEVAEQPEPVKP